MNKNKNIKIVVLSIAMLAATLFIISQFTMGKSTGKSNFVTCVSNCKGGSDIKTTVNQTSFFPICTCNANQSTINLTVNDGQLNHFEKLQAIFRAEKVDSSFGILLQNIEKAAIENNPTLYEAKVNKFDAEWSNLAKDLKETIINELNID